MNKSVLRIAIIILTLTTAVVHLALGIGGITSGEADMFSIPFLLNGLGYIGLLAAMFVPGFPVFSGNRKLTHFLLIGYTALTFVLYFVFNGFADMGPAAIISKLAELLLIIALFLHMRVEQAPGV